MASTCTPGNASAVLDAVQAICNITREELLSYEKPSSFVYARTLASLVMRDELGGSYPEIAQQLGRLNHQGVMGMVKRGRILVQQDETAKAQHSRIVELVLRRLDR